MKDKIVISFSGGETSAFMAQWLINNMNDRFEFITVFANTGQENEETLIFVDQCDKFYGLNVIWVEGKYNMVRGNGTRANVVDFKTADRNGIIFENAVRKFGILNVANPQCSRELKEQVILSYLRDHLKLKKKDYRIAIGIRCDEVDRVASNYKKRGLIYPLIDSRFCPMTKPEINSYWRDMPFRLNLKGYEGNCKVCWKKSLRKLLTIAKNNPEKFDDFIRIEKAYENYEPRPRMGTPPFRFFRNNLSCEDIIRMSEAAFEEANDDSVIYNTHIQLALFGYNLDTDNGCSESCDAFN